MGQGPDVVVVGAGAAGILAAIRAAQMGRNVVLLEKNDRPGLKILISGGGKCNITHAGSMEGLRAAFRLAEARFLKPAFYRFTNLDILELLEHRGLTFCAREDGRIFPSNGVARDVVEALAACLADAGVRVCYHSPVTGIDLSEPASDDRPEVRAVRTGDASIPTRLVIVSVGGSSYPATGTTGDGWAWAREAGHTIAKIRAALAPLYLDPVHTDWAGVALRDVSLRARQAGKVFSSWRGDLLFTHRGISGPCALGISREVAERMPAGPVHVEVDLQPGVAPDQVAAHLKTYLSANPRSHASSFVQPLLPARLLEPFLHAAGCSGEIRAAHLPQKARSAVARQIKEWGLGAVQHVPLEKGEVVAGGVSLEEVNPQTMESRLVRGLHFCGEVLDIAGPVGGYNLQAAFSTGWVAGEACG
jgi:predicted Rossmann fold flavoprotein